MRDTAAATLIEAQTEWEASDGLDVVRAGRFGVQYEPIVELATGDLHAYEALARFHREDGVTVPPAVVFERLRAAPELLLETELALKKLQIAHAPGPCVYLNVSADTWALARGAFHDVFASARIPVVVEAVENIHLSSIGRGARMLRELDALGVTAALDDLGGPNVLVCAEELHLARVLKFDRSVLRNIADPSRRALVEAMLAFARRTEKPVVAEGVETLADLELARELGFGLAQGDLFRDGYRRILPH